MDGMLYLSLPPLEGMNNMKNTPDKTSKYREDSLSLIGAVALGTGAMIRTAIWAEPS